MSARRWPISRPTEDAALRRTPNPVLPPPEALWCGLLTAYTLRDRHGLQRFGLAIVRTAAGTDR